MKRWLPLPVPLVVAVAALALAAAALADPLDPQVRITRADQARAKAALLVQSDLGMGWKGGTASSASSLKAPICPALRPDYRRLTITGHAESRFDNWALSKMAPFWSRTV